MNAWGATEPVWLKLQDDPHTVVDLAGGIRREVLARSAAGVERERLWERRAGMSLGQAQPTTHSVLPQRPPASLQGTVRLGTSARDQHTATRQPGHL
jgi:hypothetical protein